MNNSTGLSTLSGDPPSDERPAHVNGRMPADRATLGHGPPDPHQAGGWVWLGRGLAVLAFMAFVAAMMWGIGSLAP
jgi:hypothetical protein